MKQITTIDITPDKEIYEIAFKDKRFPWYWLLLLLVFLIPIPEKVSFKSVQSISLNEIGNADYRVHLDKGSGNIEGFSGKTDASGYGSIYPVTQLLGVKIYNYLLYGKPYPDNWLLNSEASIYCFGSDPQQATFNVMADSTYLMEIPLDSMQTTLNIRDSLTNAPLTDADVVLKNLKNEEIGRYKTDAQGSIIYRSLKCNETLVVQSGKAGYGTRTDTVTVFASAGNNQVFTYLSKLSEEVACGGTQGSGGSGVTVRKVDMRQQSGEFTFNYNTYSAVDSIVIYNGLYPKINHAKDLIFTTYGCVGKKDQQTVKFSHTTGFISVVVTGCDGGTSWDFQVGCPNS